MKKTLENYPQLKKEFHPSKNENLKPEHFTKGSDKKIWWKCTKGHEWQAEIYKRTAGHNCPYCSGQRVSKENNLKVLFPKLVKEWHPSKNGKLKPEHLTQGRHHKVWWKCTKGHEWQAKVYSRTSGSGCKKCYHENRKFK